MSPTASSGADRPPHNVLAAPMRGTLQAVYTGGAAGMQVLLATVFAGLPLAGAVGGHTSGLHRLTWLLLGLSVAVFGWQLQEFVRQVAVHQRPYRAKCYDWTSSATAARSVIIAVLWVSVGILDGPRALFVLAGTSLVSALYGF